MSETDARETCPNILKSHQHFYSQPQEFNLNVSQQRDKPLHHPLMYMFPVDETQTLTSVTGKGVPSLKEPAQESPF